MRKKGNIRAIDELGRIVLPIEFRNTLDIKSGDLLNMEMDGSEIIITKKNPTCVFCGTEDDIVKFKSKYICQRCIDMLKRGCCK